MKSLNFLKFEGVRELQTILRSPVLPQKKDKHRFRSVLQRYSVTVPKTIVLMSKSKSIFIYIIIYINIEDIFTLEWLSREL